MSMTKVVAKEDFDEFLTDFVNSELADWPEFVERAKKLRRDKEQVWVCSFCGKPQEVVSRLVVKHETGAAICDECTDLVRMIVEE